MKKTLTSVVLLGTVLLGCSPSPTMTMQKEESKQTAMEPRYSVKRVGVFEDNLAYNGRRGIYEITDQNTGKKYFGVSGVGISELGDHSSGKGSVADER